MHKCFYNFFCVCVSMEIASYHFAVLIAVLTICIYLSPTTTTKKCLSCEGGDIKKKQFRKVDKIWEIVSLFGKIKESDSMREVLWSTIFFFFSFFMLLFCDCFFPFYQERNMPVKKKETNEELFFSIKK